MTYLKDMPSFMKPEACEGSIRYVSGVENYRFDGKLQESISLSMVIKWTRVYVGYVKVHLTPNFFSR